jgi:hypothetical protein
VGEVNERVNSPIEPIELIEEIKGRHTYCSNFTLVST